MSFSEAMRFPIGGRHTPQMLDELNIEIIENTAEEILEVTLEMEDRLTGTWHSTDEDKRLQDQFWALFGSSKARSQDCLVGANYLRNCQDLIC